MDGWMGKLNEALAGWTSLDEMRSWRLVCLGLLAATALPMTPRKAPASVPKLKIGRRN